MPEPDLPSHDPASPGEAGGVAESPAESPAPGPGLGAEAAAAAEAAAEEEAAVWVVEPGGAPPDEPPGWFRDDALDETPDAAGAAAPTGTQAIATFHDPAAVDAHAVAVADHRVAEGTSGGVDELGAAGSDAVSAAPVEAGANDAAEADEAADDEGASAAEADEAADDEGASAAEVDEAADDEGAAATPPPSTIYRTVPPMPEGAAGPPRRRTRAVSFLVGVLILVVVGAGGFGVGWLLPLLLPLPAAEVSVGSSAPSSGGPSATPGASASASPSAPPSASPRPSPSPSAAATPRTYIVKRGDQLGRIARSFGITLQAIEAANGITNPNLIIPGQRLVIPAPVASPSASASAAP